MGNIITYLKWRGDFSFAERPFCEADNLVLAVLVYLNFNGIVSEGADEVTVHDAYEKFCGQNRTFPYDSRAYQEFFSVLAVSRRFRDAGLSYYREIFDAEKIVQFAAIQVSLGNGISYLSFRGTDNSIIGWQEDFCMGSQVVPAQREAVRYLNEVINPERQYYAGGHSKGGNLAIYGTLHCNDRLKPAIAAIYNNDGPGLSEDIVARERFQDIAGKLNWIIPEYSIVGTLFPYEKPSRIVASSADGLLQHDPFSWQIEGDSFCEKDDLVESCKFYVSIFDTWISSADLAHREAFTKDFFNALQAGGATTIEQIKESGIDGFGTILLSIATAESRTKIVITKFLKSFWDNCRKIDLLGYLRSKECLYGGLQLLAGIIMMLYPASILHLIGTAAGLCAMFFLGKRLLRHAMDQNMLQHQKKLRIISCGGLICIIEFLIVNKSAIVVSSHVVLGVLMLFLASRMVYQMPRKKSFPERVWSCAAAVLSALFGVVSLSTSDETEPLIFTIGTFMVIYGAVSMARSLYKSGARQAATRE